MAHSLLPIGSLTRWNLKNKATLCTTQIQSWLYDDKSLTVKLEAFPNKFSVKVKQQVKMKPNKQLSGYFNHVQKILVREVLLCLDKIPVIYAQTEIPVSTLTNAQTELSHIGNNSLGKILFRDPSMIRGEIEVTSFSTNSVLHNFCQTIDQNTDKTLWARRSLFYINKKPLLVSELFLPALGLY